MKDAKVDELKKLLTTSYANKAKEYNRINIEFHQLSEDLLKLKYKISKLHIEFNNSIFPSLTNIDIDKFIQSLNKSLELSFEKMQKSFIETFSIFKSEKLKIGSKYAGGFVFHLDETGKHGYVMAPHEFHFHEPVIWGVGREIIGTKTIIGSGKSNTDLIIQHSSSAKGFLFNRSVKTAARICSELVIEGYNDWFLPSKDELSLLTQNSMNTDLLRNNNLFWSSSEEDKYDAYYCSLSMNYRTSKVSCPNKTLHFKKIILVLLYSGIS